MRYAIEASRVQGYWRIVDLGHIMSNGQPRIEASFLTFSEAMLMLRRLNGNESASARLDRVTRAAQERYGISADEARAAFLPGGVYYREKDLLDDTD